MPELLWGIDFTASFGTAFTLGIQSAPARDPRGGVWEWVVGDARLFRFDESSGALLQTINISNTPGLSGYSPTSAMSIAVNGGKPIMILGTATKGATSLPVLIAIDLTSGKIVWQKIFGTATQQYNSQFPLAALGSGTYLIAARSDRPVFGLQLH